MESRPAVNGAAESVTDQAAQPHQATPLPPIPPFIDPDDWQGVATLEHLRGRDAAAVRQLVEDWTHDHGARHQRGTAPVCRDCLVRDQHTERALLGLPPLTSSLPELEREVGESILYLPLVTEWVNVGGPDVLAEQAASDPNLGRDLINGAGSLGAGDPIGLELRRTHAALELAGLLGTPELDTMIGFVDQDELHQVWWHARDEAIRNAAGYLVRNRWNMPPRPSLEDQSRLTLEQQLLYRDELDELPEPEWMIDGILTRHSYVVLTGRRSTYKSFLALDWALSMAAGRDWLGRPTKPARVLYVVGEGAFGLQQRVTAWEQAWTHDVDPERFVVLPRAVNLYKAAATVDELVDIVRAGGYSLVIFDTLRRMTSGADANAERDMGLVVDQLERIKRATDNGSVLVVAHTDKGNTSTRGSSAIEDDADIVWRTDLDDDQVKLTAAKMKDAPDSTLITLAPRARFGSVILEQVDPTRDVSNASQLKILDALRYSFTELDPPTGPQLLGTSGLEKPTFYRALKVLLQAGHIHRGGTKTTPRYLLASLTHPDQGGLTFDPAQVSPSLTQSHPESQSQSHSLTPSLRGET